MIILLMRHAHAEDGPRMDRERGITDKGKKQCKTMRRFIRDIGLKPDLIVSSDFARAIETVDRVNKKWERPTAALSALRPDGDPEKARDKILGLAGEVDGINIKTLLAVTHEPLILPLLACLAGAANVPYHHASIAAIDTDQQRMLWYAPPKLITDEEDGVLAHEAVAAAVAVAESLERADKATILDPLIARLKKAVHARFIRQARAAATAAKRDEDPLKSFRRTDTQLVNAFWSTTADAYDHGAGYVLDSLGAISEADREKPSKLKRAAILALLAEYGKTAIQLENELDDTTESRIEKLIADNPGVTGTALAALLRAMIDDAARAEMVAVNEISSAWHEGGADVVKGAVSQGVQIEKRWMTDSDPCPICEGNAQDEWIPEDILFASGASEPPQHPNCRCSLEYREK